MGGGYDGSRGTAEGQVHGWGGSKGRRDIAYARKQWRCQGNRGEGDGGADASMLRRHGARKNKGPTGNLPAECDMTHELVIAHCMRCIVGRFRWSVRLPRRPAW